MHDVKESPAVIETIQGRPVKPLTEWVRIYCTERNISQYLWYHTKEVREDFWEWMTLPAKESDR